MKKQTTQDNEIVRQDALTAPARQAENEASHPDETLAADAVLPAPLVSLPRDDAVPDADEAKAKPRRRTRAERKAARKERILSLDKDIRYRGPLSYRGMRIIAWLCLLISQIGLLVSVMAGLDESFAESASVWVTILPIFRNFMTPFFLIASFAIILNNSGKFGSLLLMYGGFSILVYLFFILVHDRYLVGLCMALLDCTRAEAVESIDLIVSSVSETGAISFNVFIDLFLCTLFTFFVVYRPKRFFTGKKLIVFRLFAILPAAYEIASIVLKALASVRAIVLPVYVYPLLTTKPPMTFFIFIILAFFIKNRESLFRRNGKSHDEYLAFLDTNLNSLHFSAFISIQIVIFAALDLLLLTVLSFAISGQFAASESPIASAAAAVSSWGFGSCIPLVVTIPFIMLFSYTRTHKDTRMDIVINIVGVALLVLLYIEVLYQTVASHLSDITNILFS